MARQLTEACGWEATPKYIVRDRNSVYGEIFTQRLRAMGIRDRPTAPQSPWQNGHTEWSITTARGHTYLSTRMRRYRGVFRPLGAPILGGLQHHYVRI